jgi:hypothetical protein
MRSLKKKDIKNFKPTKIKESLDVDVIEIDEDVEEIDELVNALGGPISGDEKSVNNSEIETAPQATSDDFNRVAVQPNRYLFNVNSVGPRVSGVNAAESVNKIAKDKMFSLLEDLPATPIDAGLGNPEKISDMNNNKVVDVKELPPNVASKLNMLIDSVDNNKLNSEQITIILNTILTNVGDKIDPNHLQILKNKF